MAKLLKKLKINEVSLVSRPAINKRFVLYKSMEEPDMVDIVETVTAPVETPVVEEKPLIETETPVVKEEVPVVEAPVEKASKKCPECGEDMEDDMCKGCSGKKVKKEVEDLSKALETEKLEKEAVLKELEELRILKAEVEKQAAIEKELRITKEFIQKAAKDMNHIPGIIADGFGVCLKEMAEKLTPETYTVVYNALHGASEMLAKNSVLTKEIGTASSMEIGETPASQLDAIAKSILMKSGEKITYAEAYVKACEDNPKIYRQHVLEQRK